MKVDMLAVYEAVTISAKNHHIPDIQREPAALRTTEKLKKITLNRFKNMVSIRSQIKLVMLDNSHNY